MSEFKAYHPIVNFIYFVFVIGFSCVFMHPASLCISLFCGFAYHAQLKGRRAIKGNLLYMLPMMLIMALINPLVNHNGVTIIRYLPSGNPLTMESVIYGIAGAMMLISIICWFSCCSEIMTSDKILWLFGRVIPSLALVVSMTLRFVPQFFAGLKQVAKAQQGIGRGVSTGNIIQRAKGGLSVLSIMITRALENSIETADSMNSRGYGNPGRTAFSIFVFDKRDAKALVCIAILGIYTLAGGLLGGMYFSYFPSMAGAEWSPFTFSVFAAYFALCIIPIIIERWEARRWKSLKSKI